MSESVAVQRPSQLATDGHGAVSCPECTSGRFECEACLHQHLVQVHGVRYSEVYGQMPTNWPDLCQAHRSLTGNMLGM